MSTLERELLFIMTANNIIAGSVDEVNITKLLLLGSFDDVEIILAILSMEAKSTGVLDS